MLRSRFIDFAIIGWLSFALLASLTTDFFQAFLHFVPREQIAASAYIWFYQHVHDVYWWWCEVDLLLAVNPLWYQIMAYVSPLFYAPFYLYAIPAFWKQSKSVRIPGLVFAGCMFYSLVVIVAEELFGEYKSPRPDLILAAYSSYLIMPLVIAWRLLPEDPFAKRASSNDAAAKKKTKAH